MKISNMFHYMCTIFSENITSGLKTQLPLRRTGVVFSLKVAHMYRKILQTLILCLYLITLCI